jgi:hypothetical protein
MAADGQTRDGSNLGFNMQMRAPIIGAAFRF